jgi:hypothetical protein
VRERERESATPEREREGGRGGETTKVKVREVGGVEIVILRNSDTGQ